LHYQKLCYSIFQEQSNLFDIIYLCHEVIREYSCHKSSKRTIISLHPRRRLYNFSSLYHKMILWRTGRKNVKIYNETLKLAIKLYSVYKGTLNLFPQYLKMRNKKTWV
jgi:hypothetical protein